MVKTTVISLVCFGLGRFLLSFVHPSRLLDWLVGCLLYVSVFLSLMEANWESNLFPLEDRQIPFREINPNELPVLPRPSATTKRLVVFFVDGGGAIDLFKQPNRFVPRFLRGVMARGRWGITHVSPFLGSVWLLLVSSFFIL
jgi:hypothetical protein